MLLPMCTPTVVQKDKMQIFVLLKFYCLNWKLPPIWAVPRGLAYRWNKNPQQFGFEFRDLEVNKKMLKTWDLWLERLHTIDMIYSTNIILPGSIAENYFGLAIPCVTTYF